MGKIIFLFVVAFCNLNFSQDKVHEIKVNLLYLSTGVLDVGYEKNLNNESSIGATLLLSNGKEIKTIFAIKPYYRFYLGKKITAGFFLEGFSALEHFNTLEYNNSSEVYEHLTKNDLAVGFGFGGKWITKKRMLYEISTGWSGRVSSTSTLYDLSLYDPLHINISIGHRF